MRLIGSLTEQAIRNELVASNRSLKNGDLGRLVKVLESLRVSVEGAYILDWIPEQAEDIYTILISPDEIIKIEVPHDGAEFLLDRMKLAEYGQGRPRKDALKIAVALDLQVRRAEKFLGSR